MRPAAETPSHTSRTCRARPLPAPATAGGARWRAGRQPGGAGGGARARGGPTARAARAGRGGGARPPGSPAWCAGAPPPCGSCAGAARARRRGGGGGAPARAASQGGRTSRALRPRRATRETASETRAAGTGTGAPIREVSRETVPSSVFAAACTSAAQSKSNNITRLCSSFSILDGSHNAVGTCDPYKAFKNALNTILL